MHIPPRAFTRTRLTWMAYAMLAYFSFIPSALGPLLPFLRLDLGLNYTWGGLHLTALSLGIIISGSFGERLVRYLGRPRVLWGCAAGIALGAVGLASAWHIVQSIVSAFLMGSCGALIQILVQALLSDQHGDRRAVALTEANIAASLGTALAPLVIAACVRLGLGWRVAVSLELPALLVLYLSFRRTPIPDASQLKPSFTGRAADAELVSRRLPSLYWAYWGMILLFVAIEWSLWVWGAEFFISVVGMGKLTATIVVAAFLSVGVLGRMMGSRLARTYSVLFLATLALGLAGAGFLTFWLSPYPVLRIFGYLVAGLGVTNLFPLGMSLAVGSAPQQSDLASARISLAIGLSGGSAPFLLGWIADQVGIQDAYSFVAVALGLGLLLVLLVPRLSRDFPGRDLP